MLAELDIWCWRSEGEGGRGPESVRDEVLTHCRARQEARQERASSSRRSHPSQSGTPKRLREMSRLGGGVDSQEGLLKRPEMPKPICVLEGRDPG